MLGALDGVDALELGCATAYFSACCAAPGSSSRRSTNCTRRSTRPRPTTAVSITADWARRWPAEDLWVAHLDVLSEAKLYP
ncbi:MAG: hypothetical protein FJW88_08030 [Actinobacteria bacterium]|nr:hypothetical protein [Actinomycetota bacterium]